jgi:hypothetical protein
MRRLAKRPDLSDAINVKSCLSIWLHSGRLEGFQEVLIRGGSVIVSLRATPR